MQYLQLGEPPLYYLLATLPVWLLRTKDITSQLYAARLMSLTLFLVSVVSARRITRQLTMAGDPLRWIVPLTMALLPGFVDLMTAVNNSSGEIAVFSLFLWGSTMLVRRGLSFLDLMWVLVTAALCFLAKNTTFIAVPLNAIVVLSALLRGRWHKVPWGEFVLAGDAGFAAIFSWGDAAFWYRSTSQIKPTRVKSSLAPLGTYALQLDVAAEVTPAWLRPLYQPLPTKTVQSLHGKMVTLGAWMWGGGLPEDSEPSYESSIRMVFTPFLNDGQRSYFREVTLEETPTFYAFSVELPETTPRLWLALEPTARNKGFDDSSNRVVFYDL